MEVWMQLSLIIPTYNEVENISSVILAVGKALGGIDYEIIVSDDDSPDLTWACVEEIGKHNLRVRSLRRTGDRALSASVVDGFTQARGDTVACIDADLQHDASLLPAMLREIEKGADLVVGTRYMPGGGTGGWSRFRRFSSWTATKMAKILLHAQLRDPMSGFFMLRREDFLRVRKHLNRQGFKILLEIATHMRPRDLREVPYTFRARTRGKSKLSSRVALAYLRQLWHLSFLDQLIPADFVKFAIVGATGVVVNLSVMALLLSFTLYRDWRASAMATLAATANNYMLNNFWTFRDRTHSRATFVTRYMRYLFVSLVGLAVTTVTYAGFAAGMGKILRGLDAGSNLHKLVLLGSQFLAILAGTFFSYKLNRVFTWPHCLKDVEVMSAVQTSWGVAKAAAADLQSTNMDAQQQAR
jgi:dolichol-phosphate mannosyltransferase